MHEILTCLPIFSCEKHDFLRESKSQPPNLKIPLPKLYKDMITAKIGNFRFLAKIDIYVNSATEFAHLGHFGTEIRTFLNFETRFCSFSNVREISKRNSRTNALRPKFTHFWNFRDPKFALFIFLRNSETELVFSGVKISNFCRLFCENLGKFATEIHDGNLRIFISLKKSEPRLVYFGSKTRYLVRFC